MGERGGKAREEEPRDFENLSRRTNTQGVVAHALEMESSANVKSTVVGGVTKPTGSTMRSRLDIGIGKHRGLVPEPDFLLSCFSFFVFVVCPIFTIPSYVCRGRK